MILQESGNSLGTDRNISLSENKRSDDELGPDLSSWDTHASAPPPEGSTTPLGAASRGTILNNDLGDIRDSSSQEDSDNIGGSDTMVDSTRVDEDAIHGNSGAPAEGADADMNVDAYIPDFQELDIEYELAKEPPTEPPGSLPTLSSIESRSLQYFWAMKRSNGTVRQFNMFTAVSEREGRPGKVLFLSYNTIPISRIFTQCYRFIGYGNFSRN